MINPLTISAVLLGLVSTVSSAALPAQDTELSLYKRVTHDTTTWDKYHETNSVFARLGYCMSYIDPTPRDGSWACGEFCPNTNTRVCWTPAASLELPHLINYNPNGERWVLGECHCDTAVDKLAGIIVDFTAKGLDEGFRHLAKLSCSITMEVLKEAAFAGAQFIPGAGQAAVAARTMAKGVKLAAKTTGGKDIWTRTVEGTCGVFDKRPEIYAGYDVLMQQEDEG